MDFLFGFYGPFQNISLISSRSFVKGGHRGLLAKFNHCGITGNLQKWFDKYLSNRFQKVTIPGGCSEWVEIKAGVPQGSILVFFLRYFVATEHHHKRVRCHEKAKKKEV